MTGNLTNKVALSIIIPVLNEERALPRFIDTLIEHSSLHNQYIFVDGGSTDSSCRIISEHPNCELIQSEKGRAKQMNRGVKQAKFPILYFLHVDSIPPKDYDQCIVNTIESGVKAGSFRLQFDAAHFLLTFFAYLSRFNLRICRGGDQSLFIRKELFLLLDGFNETYWICEDNEFIDRVYEKTNFSVLPNRIITSARRFEENGVIRLYIHHGVIQLMRCLGASPQSLANYYQTFIR